MKKVSDILTKVKSWLSQDIAPEINLRKKYPNYFNMWVIRGMWVLLAVLVAGEYLANNNSFTSVFVECKDPKGCLNPFYECPPEYLNISNIYTLEPKQCVEVAVFCPEQMCKKEFLTYGEKYGRQGIGFLEVMLILAGGLLCNHLVYMCKRKQ